MRLRDVIKGQRDEEPLDDRVQAELDALDAALAGEDVPEGMEGLATLVADLREERPLPDESFARRLDGWAERGFPRRERPPRRSGGAQAGGWRIGGRRVGMGVLAPAGAVCLLLAVVGVAVVSTPRGGDHADSVPMIAEDSATSAPEAPVSDGAVEESVQARGAGAGAAALDSGAGAPGLRANEGNAANAAERKVERAAQLTLAASADEVQEVTNEAIAVVQSYNGIVLSSRASTSAEVARATLQLQIPTRNLDAALDALSSLADVKNMSETTLDITKPFVDIRERVRDLRAERTSLLRQIESATSEDQLNRLKDRLTRVNGELARAKAELRGVKHRAQQSQVTLEITSDGAREGDWSVSDALDDAKRVLEVGAGVALIAGAVLLPLALFALIALLLIRAARGRAREKALDD